MSARPLASSPFASQKALVMQGMQASITARTKAGLDLQSPACIYGLCEAHNVNVRFNDINMEGMYDRQPKPRIHVSALRPLARRTFTCAHELGHHVFGHGSTIDELRDDHAQSADRPPNEVLADSFAAFVLMPTLGLREAFVKRGLDPNKASDYLVVVRVLKGAIKRSSCATRSAISPASKRSNRLCGSRCVATGGMNRSRTDRHNGVNGKSTRHHLRQRFSVRPGMLSSSHSA